MTSSNEKTKGDSPTHFNNHRLHRSSHCLQSQSQTNLHEVDEKIKGMISIIEEDGDSLAKRAEMYYKRRPQLLKAVDDLHKSYRCLALNYDQLRSHFTPLKSLRSHSQVVLGSESSTFLVLSTADEAKQRLVQKTPQTVFDTEMINNENIGSSICSSDGVINEADYERFESNDKKVSGLIEDHLRYQAELVRSNESKRQKIRELRSQVKKLMDENKALKSTLTLNNTTNKSTLCFGKLTGCSG